MSKTQKTRGRPKKLKKGGQDDDLINFAKKVSDTIYANQKVDSTAKEEIKLQEKIKQFESGLINKSSLKKTSDHVYYNITIGNTGSSPIPLTFEETRTVPIIDNPDDYFLSIIRMTIPGTTIPKFIFAPATYSVTLSWTDYSTTPITNYNYQVFLDYQSQNQIGITESGYYYVYSYQALLDMINSALTEAFQQIKSSTNFPSTVTIPPFIIYEPENQLFRVVAQQTYNQTGVKIYINNQLRTFFGSTLQYFFTSDTASLGKNYQLITKQDDSNSVVLTPTGYTYPYWKVGKAYALGNIVLYRSNYYVALVTSGNTGQYPDTTGSTFWAVYPYNWLATYSYKLNDVIYYNGLNYISIVEPNLAVVPSQGTGANWRIYTGNDQVTIPTQWSSVVVYAVGNIRMYLGNAYISLTAGNLNNIPTATLGVNWDYYIFPTGLGVLIQTWNSAYTYQVSNIVLYQGLYYQSLASANINNNPITSLANWTPYNGYNMYEMRQEFAGLTLWNSFSSVVVTSNTIGAKNELVPNQIGTGAANFRPVLSDLEVSDSGPEVFNYVQYVPFGEYKLIDLQSNVPLVKVDIQLWWQDTENNLQPIFITPGDYANLKLMFRKKNIAKMI